MRDYLHVCLRIVHACRYVVSMLLDDYFLCIHFISSNKQMLMSFQCHAYSMCLIMTILSN